MRKLDKVTMAQSVFCLVLAGLGAGCGDDSKTTTKLDGAVDRAPDVLAPDSAKADTLVPADVAKADTAEADTAKADVPLPLDTAKLDIPPTLDVSRGETAVDTGGVDTELSRDVAEADAPSVLDAGAGETVTGIDGMGTPDADATTMASITFHLENQGAQTVYLRSNCWLTFEVTSTADGAVYANTMLCGCNCADTGCTGQVACGQCAPPSGIAVAAGQTRDLAWQARKSTLETNAGTTGSFQCVAHAPIATGVYNLAVRVYPTEADAVAETNGRTVQQSFVLGTTNATVAVSIQ